MTNPNPQEIADRKSEILGRAKSELIAQGISPKISLCYYIEASELIPKDIASDFWGVIYQDAPFSWGDNNRTLICCCDLARHCETCEDSFSFSKKKYNELVKYLYSLGDTYVDLEN